MNLLKKVRSIISPVIIYLYMLGLGNSEVSANIIISVSDLGIYGDGKSDVTDLLQKPLNTGKYSELYFSPGEYLINYLSLPTNIKLKGEFRSSVIFKFNEKDHKGALLEGIDIINLEIDGITLLNYSDKFIHLIKLTGNTSPLQNIFIRNCFFFNENSEVDCILLEKKMQSICIESCIIKSQKNPIVKNNYTQTSCIKIKSPPDDERVYEGKIIIKNNHLINGNAGLRCTGRGVPPGPLFFLSNVVEGQIGVGAFFYHVNRQIISGNHFKNIIASAFENNDGGVVWLDQYKDGEIIFSENTIENCIGNGIYEKELQDAIINNNIIRNLHKREDKYTIHLESFSLESYGGNAILLTGGCKEVMITKNHIKENEGSGILINKYLGVHFRYYVGNIIISENHISFNRENGIRVIGKVGNLTVNNNLIINNCSNENEAASVYIERIDERNHLNLLIFSNNTIDKSVNSDKYRQFYGIYNPYNWGKLICNNNLIVTSGGTPVVWKNKKEVIMEIILLK